MNISTGKVKKMQKTSKEVDCSCIFVVYKSKSGLWRGFAHPYDVTFESTKKSEVMSILRKMVDSYEDGLRKYDHPSHLVHMSLSDEEDRERFSRLALDAIVKRGSVEGLDYYVEAKLPA